MTNKSQNDEDALFNRWLENMTIQLTKEENKLNNNSNASVEVKTWLNKAIGIFQKTKEIYKEKENKENKESSYIASKEMVELSIWQLRVIFYVFEKGLGKSHHDDKFFFKKCIDDMEQCLKGNITTTDLHSNFSRANNFSDRSALVLSEMCDTHDYYQAGLLITNFVRAIAKMCCEDDDSIFNKQANSIVKEAFDSAYFYLKARGADNAASEILEKRNTKYTEIFGDSPPNDFWGINHTLIN